MRTVLITTANGMFGGGLARELAGAPDVQVRALVRDRSKFTAEATNIEVVEGDMDRPESLAGPMEGVTNVFLAAPISDQIGPRYKNVVEAAKNSGQPHIAAIHGAVNHKGDALEQTFDAGIEALKSSGLPWTLISPTSVMETALNAVEGTAPLGCVLSMTADGKNALVANRDVAIATRVVVTGSGHDGKDYKITGPQLLDMEQICAAISKQLGRTITYYDLPEDEFAAMMLKNTEIKDPAVLEQMVIMHLRAWKEGRAEVITDTFTELTGEPGTTLEDWLKTNHRLFDAKPTIAQRATGALLRGKYGKYAKP